MEEEEVGNSALGGCDVLKNVKNGFARMVWTANPRQMKLVKLN